MRLVIRTIFSESDFFSSNGKIFLRIIIIIIEKRIIILFYDRLVVINSFVRDVDTYPL